MLYSTRITRKAFFGNLPKRILVADGYSRESQRFVQGHFHLHRDRPFHEMDYIIDQEVDEEAGRAEED
jgi:hypothetical protein